MRESKLYGQDAAVVANQLKKIPREDLEEALLDMYNKLYCGAAGNYIPEESEAADSASDFVASCDMVFQRVDLKVE